MGDELGTGRPGGVAVDWPACSVTECMGARVGSYGRCWAHLCPEELQQALGSLSPGQDLDVRGVILNERLLSRILDALSDPQSRRPQIGRARFDRAQFSGDASFYGAEFSGNAWFNGAVFSGVASFNRTVFGCDAWFNDANFRGDARFNHAVFRAKAWFGEVRFGRDAWFYSAGFSGDALFMCAEFIRNAFFNGAAFSGDALFTDAGFGGSARFDHAELTGNGWFDRVVVGGDARFESARVEGGLLMGPLVVGGAVVLSGVRAGGMVRVAAEAKAVLCRGAEFGGRVWLSLWGGEVSLVDSVFGEPVTVESSLEPFSWAGHEHVPGECSRVVLRSLRGTDAAHLTLVDVDLGRCVLSGLRRPELLRLDGRCGFAPVPAGWCVRAGWVPWRWMGREALFEEHVWRRSVGAPGRGAGWAEPELAKGGAAVGMVGPARLAVLYRQLRLAVESAGNEPGAADLYYGEMEMRRLGAVRRGERWLLGGYWLVSGYGLRAGRALLVLGGLVLAVAVALQHGGFLGRGPGFMECVLYAAGSVVSLDQRGHLPGALTEWGEVIRLVLRVGGPVLLSLAALAVRGRVKR
jgi:Pentapeptide repeats (9 copies)